MTKATPDGIRVPTFDAARGAALVCVVFYHSLLFAQAQGVFFLPWDAVVGLVRLIPLSTFFVVSGYLARGTLRDRDRLLDRLRRLAVAYVVGAVLYLGTFSLVEFPRATATGFGTLEGVLRELVLPDGYLWFLYALAAALVITALTLRLPAGAVVAAALVVSAASAGGWVSTTSDRLDEALVYLPAFMVGARMPAVVQTLATAAPGGTARSARAGVFLAFLLLTAANVVALLTGALPHLTAVDGVPVLGSALLLVSTGTGLVVARALSRTVLGVALARLGRRTLGVYLLHEIVLGLVVTAGSGWWPRANEDLAPLVTPVLAAVGIGVPLVVLALLRRGRGALVPQQVRDG